MACGRPYAVAAAVAYPDRQVVCFVGDGGLTMLMGEMATLIKYNLNVKIVVIKNNVLGQIKWEQMVFLGHPEYVCELQPIDFATIAQGFGLTAFRIDDPKACAETLRTALASPGPVLIEATVDPNEPPMPPKIEAKQAANFAQALAKGTPRGGRIALTSSRTKSASWSTRCARARQAVTASRPRLTRFQPTRQNWTARLHGTRLPW